MMVEVGIEGAAMTRKSVMFEFTIVVTFAATAILARIMYGLEAPIADCMAAELGAAGVPEGVPATSVNFSILFELFAVPVDGVTLRSI